MWNKFYLLVLLFHVFAMHSHAQSITQQRLSSGGGTLSNGGIQLSFTVGELTIEPFTDSVISVSTGLFGKQALIAKEAPLVAGTTGISVSALCATGSAVLSATGFANAGQYQWEYSSDSFATDVQPLPGQTTPDSATTGTVAATTHYRLRACCTNGGLPVYSNIVALTINQPPTPPAVSLSGTDTFCAGGKATLHSSAFSGNQWFKDGAAIGGATGPTYEATQSGSYTATATGNGCTSGASNTAVVTVLPLPQTPVITQSGNRLLSSAPQGNQWYLGGAVIEGATDTVYTPVASGNYSVQVSANGCSSPLSNTVAFVPVALPDPLWAGPVRLYPNPFNNRIIIEHKSAVAVIVQFFDASGRMILSRQLSTQKEEIGTGLFGKGLYFVRLSITGQPQSVVSMVVKQ